MSADLQNRAAQAVEMAKAAGAKDAWATASQGRDVEFEFRDGSLEKVKDTTSRSLDIRVYADDRYSNHQTTDLSPDRLKGFISEAVAITRALEPDEHRRITPAELFTGRPTDDLDLVDPAVAEISREQRLEWCESLDRVATDHERVISATAGVYDGTLNSASQAVTDLPVRMHRRIAGMARTLRSGMRVKNELQVDGTPVANTSTRCLRHRMSRVSGWIARSQGLARRRARRSRRLCLSTPRRQAR